MFNFLTYKYLNTSLNPLIWLDIKIRKDWYNGIISIRNRIRKTVKIIEGKLSLSQPFKIYERQLIKKLRKEIKTKLEEEHMLSEQDEQQQILFSL